MTATAPEGCDGSGAPEPAGRFGGRFGDVATLQLMVPSLASRRRRTSASSRSMTWELSARLVDSAPNPAMSSRNAGRASLSRPAVVAAS